MKITSLILLRTFLLIQPSMWLSFIAARAHCWNALACCPPEASGLFLASCLLARQKNACTIVWDYSIPATTLYIYLPWAAWHSCPPFFSCPPVQQPPPVWCCDNCGSLADAENSDLVAAWRYRGKTSSQICDCLRLTVYEQRKKLFVIGKKKSLLLMPL